MASWEQERAKVWQIIFRYKRRVEELEEQVKFLTLDPKNRMTARLNLKAHPTALTI